MDRKQRQAEERCWHRVECGGERNRDHGVPNISAGDWKERIRGRIDRVLDVDENCGSHAEKPESKVNRHKLVAKHTELQGFLSKQLVVIL